MSQGGTHILTHKSLVSQSKNVHKTHRIHAQRTNQRTTIDLWLSNSIPKAQHRMGHGSHQTNMHQAARERDQEAWLEEKRARDTQEAAAHEDVALGAAHASQQSHTRTRGVHEITQVQMRDGLCTRHRPSVTREARHLTLSPPASHLLKLTGSRLTIRAIHPSADAVPTSRLPPLPSWAAAVRQSGPSPRAQLAIR